MLKVSNEFKQLMKQRTDFKEYAEVTLLDGTKILLDESDFTVSNNEMVDGAGLSTFPVGVAVQKRIQIELLNDTEQYEEFDFYGAKIRLYLTFQLSKTVERVEKGTYTVVTPETHGETVIINAYDDMYRADKAYETNLTFPASIGVMLRDICSRCDIPLLTTTFPNSTMKVSEAPTGEYTYRQIIGYIAMLAGGNARINCRGYLEIKNYEFLTNTYDGGDFSFSNGDTVLDGGDFTFSNGSNGVQGGVFSPWDADMSGAPSDISEEQKLVSWNSVTLDTNDIEITGVALRYQTDDGEQSVMTGKEGYVISVENPLASSDVKQGVLAIAGNLLGLKFRKFEGEHIANPLIEFMDTVFVTDRRGRSYKSFVTDVTFRFLGYTSIKNNTPSYIGNEASYPSPSVIVEARARKLIERERTDRELAVEQLANALKNSSGLYITVDTQPDGSGIYYMHNKSTLAESDIVWKLTAEAFGISTDGGKTYPYGFTVTGEMITRILNTEGVNADWIRTGSLVISDNGGNVLFSANMDTNTVQISGAAITDASITGAKIKNAAITGAKIANATITDAKISGLSADKIKTGTLDASSITVKDLSANSITGGALTSVDGASFFDLDNGNISITSEDSLVRFLIEKPEHFGNTPSYFVKIQYRDYVGQEWKLGPFSISVYKNSLGDRCTVRSEIFAASNAIQTKNISSNGVNVWDGKVQLENVTELKLSGKFRPNDSQNALYCNWVPVQDMNGNQQWVLAGFTSPQG